MNNEFKLIVLFKDYIESFNKYLVNYPNKDIIRNRIININLDILELIYLTNLLDDRKDNQVIILSKINMLNYYLEVSLKNKYLSIKVFNNLSNKLEVITKMIYGWIKYEC